MNKGNGLSSKDVIINRDKYGENIISGSRKDSFFKMFIESFGDPIIKILLVALGIKVFFLFRSFDWYETIGILIAILIASFISTISEYGSERAFLKLQEEASRLKCRVKRDGVIGVINVDDVVVGDIVLLETGDKVPADGIIVDGDFALDESSITGESKEVNKKSVIDINNYKEENFVYRGTVVYSGVGLMLVTAVGNNTFYGKVISDLLDNQPESPLKLKLRDLACSISKLGYIGSILVSLSYLFNVIFIDNNFDFSLIVSTVCNFREMFGHILYALTLSVTVIVVAVPEGLPMMITLVLSSNVRRMIKDNVMVRKMVGIETAGSLNILFTDKTGTLTNGVLDVVGFMPGSLKEFSSFSSLARYDSLYTMVILNCFFNNSSSFVDGHAVGGNITDRAILNYVGLCSIDAKIVSSVPFDSNKKYSSCFIDYSGKRINLFKGAPEVILKNCNKFLSDNGSVKYFYDKKSINNIIDLKTANGVRVLALAYGEANVMSDLIFIGLLFIKDEVRKSAIEGIDLVRRAGIQTVMITGDNKNTAVSIAREVGIVSSSSDIVLTSDELNLMSDDEVKGILSDLRVVSRSLPQDKSRLVRLSQELGLVVGMTGDGVNDAPALKKADVGFSMGSGTEVAREASDIIILDDNFKSISSAILYGRTIFKSIRKFIIFQLTVNLCAVSLSVVGPLVGIHTPVTVIQMLWINMVMDTLAGIAFSFEPPLLEYMNEKPKKRDESIINSYMKNEIIVTGIYSSILCLWFLKSDFISGLFRGSINDKYLLSAFFGLFIFIGIFNSFNARTSRINIFANIFKNKVFLFVIFLIVTVQIILIYFGGELFRTIGLSFKEFNFMLLLSLTVIPFDWIRKYFIKLKSVDFGV